MKGNSAEILRALLPKPETLLDALAPEGWVRSPLHRVFHPTAEQRAEEVRRFRRGIEDLSRREAANSLPRADEGAVFQAQASCDTVGDPAREVVELLGLALWDIFSGGHSVIDANGSADDLGTFRGAARFIAEILEERYPAFGRRGYIDFYMGTTLVAHRADLRPVYRWIFHRLREAGRDWRYVFPRIQIVQLSERDDEGFETYDPSVAVRAELERGKQEEELRALEEKLDRAHEEAVERARHEPPPSAVAAYRDVYGALPEGWPPR
jgi:hypothetical protein